MLSSSPEESDLFIPFQIWMLGIRCWDLLRTTELRKETGVGEAGDGDDEGLHSLSVLPAILLEFKPH